MTCSHFCQRGLKVELIREDVAACRFHLRGEPDCRKPEQFVRTQIDECCVRSAIEPTLECPHVKRLALLAEFFAIFLQGLLFRRANHRGVTREEAAHFLPGPADHQRFAGKILASLCARVCRNLAIAHGLEQHRHLGKRALRAQHRGLQFQYAFHGHRPQRVAGRVYPRHRTSLLGHRLSGFRRHGW